MSPRDYTTHARVTFAAPPTPLQVLHLRVSLLRHAEEHLRHQTARADDPAAWREQLRTLRAHRRTLEAELVGATQLPNTQEASR